MSTLDLMARHTCEDVLTAADLREICRYRGFAVPSGNKAAVADFVAPRLAGPEGVSAAMATLDPKWCLVLHAVALAGGSCTLYDLRELLVGQRWLDAKRWRSAFRALVDGLADRGVVVIDPHPKTRTTHGSRFADMRVVLPDEFRVHLPPFPVAVGPLGPKPEATDPVRIVRDALTMAAGGSQARSDLVRRVASSIHIDGGGLRVGKNHSPDLRRLLRLVEQQWKAGDGTSKKARALREAALHVLSHLPPGQGAEVEQLGAALDALQDGLPTQPIDAVRTLCVEGVEAGLLVRSGAGDRARYSLRREFEAASSDGAIAWKADDAGLSVDLRRAALSPTLELAALCRVDASKGRLVLRPDAVLLGRFADVLDDIEPLARARAACLAFEAAVQQVMSRRGKIQLHEGLVLLEIADLALRTIITHRLGDRVRSLSGAWLAVPGDARDEVVHIINRDGFSPRMVSE